MAKDKLDFLQECMSSAGVIPLDQFQLGWCRVCANRECSRSKLNGSVFDRRAATWQDVLFNRVPRARDDDPTVEGIRSKLFLPISPERAQSGHMPSFVTVSQSEQETSIAPTPPPRFVQPEPLEEEESPDTDRTPPVEEAQPPAPLPQVSEPVAAPEPVTQVPTELSNTPFQQGTVLQGGPVSHQKSEGEDVFIQPGGTFTFGE